MNMDTDRIKAALEGLIALCKTVPPLKMQIVLNGTGTGSYPQITETEAKVIDAKMVENIITDILPLLSAPSPVGQEARKLIDEIQHIKWLVEECGASTKLTEVQIRLTALKDKAASSFQSALDAAVAGERERVVEECKDAIMSGSFLSRESPEYKWAESVCKVLDAIKEAKR